VLKVNNDALRRDQLAADRVQAGSLRSPEHSAGATQTPRQPNRK
jgi:hypothetical protein